VIWLVAALCILEARVNFKKEVRPILAEHCIRCHGASNAARGLRLHSRERALMAIVPRKPEESRAFTAARAGIMPPTAKKLSAREVETFRKWIAEGARWPKNFEIPNP
jgi:mono/diheme cytochrome c family protein